jgi:hypothetical protein
MAGSANAEFDLNTSSSSLVLYNAGSTAFSGAIPLGAISGSNSAATLQGATHSNNAIYQIGALGLTTTFAGLVENGTSSGHYPLSLEIVGGNLTLTNANTYTNVPNQAGTTINAGAVYAGNSTGSATGTGTVVVDGNTGIGVGYGTLGGTGFISGLVTVDPSTSPATMFSNGGILAPGTVTGATGTLTLSGGLTLNDYSNLDFTLNGLSDVSFDDLIAVTGGTLTMPSDGNVQANLSFTGGGPAYGTVYTLISYVAPDSYGIGNSTSLGSWVLNTNLGEYGSAVLSDTGSAIEVTIVPEPASLGLLSLGALGLLRRRRTRA